MSLGANQTFLYFMNFLFWRLSHISFLYCFVLLFTCLGIFCKSINKVLGWAWLSHGKEMEKSLEG